MCVSWRQLRKCVLRVSRVPQAQTTLPHAILIHQGGGRWRASSCGHVIVRRFVRPSSWANSSIAEQLSPHRLSRDLPPVVHLSTRPILGRVTRSHGAARGAREEL